MKRVAIAGGPGPDSAVALVAALIGARHFKSRPYPAPTPAQIAAADKRTERKRWNDEVEARKAEKKAAKVATQGAHHE